MPLLNPSGHLEAAMRARGGEALSPKVRPPPNAPDPTDRTRWPVWARLVASQSSAEDAGVGDTVERVVGPFGGRAFKVWHLAVFGVVCRCAQRQAEWNTRFPYSPSA